MDICHITLTAERESRLPLFPDEGSYREALHRLGAVCQGCLALFALIAEHLHLVARLERQAAGRLAQRVLVSLGPVVATPFAPSHFQPVESRSHMRWLLRYLLEQPKEHGMSGHPALWVGSCFPDLAGARRIDGLSLCIDSVLPDFSQAAALRILGLPGSSLAVADSTTLQTAGANRLVQAASAVFAVESSLRGKSRQVLGARRAAAQLAERVGVPRSEVIAALGQCSGSAYRLRNPAADPSVLMSIARRVSLENLVQESQSPVENAISSEGLRRVG